MSSKVGYARVSTARQANKGVSLEAQEKALREAGCTKVFVERGVSGSKASRPELDAMLDYLRPGDEVVVYKLDRIGRNTRHVLELVEKFDELGVTFRSLSDGLTTEGAMGRAMLTIMAAFAQLERDQLIERTNEGLAMAAEQGRFGGRPPVTAHDDRVVKARELRDKRGLSATEIGAILGVSRATAYRWLKTATELSTT